MKIYLSLLSLVFIGAATMVQAIEEPAYIPLGQVGKIELREYAPSIQARTPMTVESRSSSTFQRLANYIFGGNTRKQSIAMTAPVETRMDAHGYMAFTMPSQYSLSDLPLPLNDNVSLHKLPARRLAVLSFGGWATDGKVKRKTQELLDTLQAHGIETLGPPSLNQYNPPWTPPWNRRNEVCVEIVN